MYIIKNALRCIGRSKGRNVLISIITLVIAVSACIGLSIRQAAESAKKDTLEELNITAAISYDRSSMMNGMTGGEKFDREQFAEMMGNTTALTVEDYEKYASAESVEDFYYTVTAAFNGTDELLPVTDETADSESESDAPSSGFGTGKVFPGGKGGFSSSAFSVIGYSSDSAITGSVSATYVFENTEKYYAFEEEVRNLGLDDSYTVSSPDITAFENSLTPLNTLSTMAGWFLLVILIIGAIILVVLNIFNVRERKYEVGVLTAMGMKKWKVAAQFMCEILVVTMISVMNKGDEIPQEQREQIFERFYRADTARNSEDNRYGLGLAIAKAIAVSHKGKIEVQCYDGFVEFKIQIPTL